MSEINHIRWSDRAHLDSLTGFVGTLGPWVFRIKPERDSGRWVLTTKLPGMFDDCHSDDPGELKQEAEAWLDEFISSLGASFPDPEAGQ